MPIVSPFDITPRKNTANPLAPKPAPIAPVPSGISPKPTTSPVSAAPAATSPAPAPTPVAAPKPSTGAMSYVQGGGLTQADVMANLSKAGFSGAPTAGSTSTPAPAPADAKSTYLAKLRELSTASEAETIASKSLADINSNIFGTKFEGEEARNAKMDETGLLKGGAETAANRLGMRTNQELARLAVQQNAAANSLQAITGEREGKLKGAGAVQIGNDFYDPNTGEKLYTDPKANEAFNLSEGQTRYAFNEKTGKYEQVANAPKTTAPGTGSSLTEASLMQFVTNPSLLNTLSPAKRSEVVLAMAAQGINIPNSNGDALSAYQLADELSKLDYAAITGAGQNPLNATGLTNAETINKYTQLKSVLALENRAKLKGSGAISDFEARTLDAASSALGRNLSNDEFERELNKVKGALGTAAGLSMPVSVVDPKTGSAKEGFASREEINSAIQQGFSVNYI